MDGRTLTEKGSSPKGTTKRKGVNLAQGSRELKSLTADKGDDVKHRGKAEGSKTKKGKKGCKSSTEPAVKTPRKDVTMPRRRCKDFRLFLAK